jgi:hypothetical protein
MTIRKQLKNNKYYLQFCQIYPLTYWTKLVPSSLRPLLSGLAMSRQPLQPPTQSWKANLGRGGGDPLAFTFSFSYTQKQKYEDITKAGQTYSAEVQ